MIWKRQNEIHAWLMLYGFNNYKSKSQANLVKPYELDVHLWL